MIYTVLKTRRKPVGDEIGSVRLSFDTLDVIDAETAEKALKTAKQKYPRLLAGDLVLQGAQVPTTLND